MARLAAKQQTGVAQFGRYITAHGPYMARLHIAARAIFDPLIFSDEKAYLHTPRTSTSCHEWAGDYLEVRTPALSVTLMHSHRLSIITITKMLRAKS